jgi:hypothetical protein
MRRLWIVLASLTAPALCAGGAESAWVGTWVLDPAKSNLAGDTFTVTQGRGNLLHYSDGSTIEYDFGLDGKEYKSAYDHTTRWTATGPNAWDTVTSAGGKELYRAHRVLSPDGKTYTITSTGTRPDGSPDNQVYVYQRVSGTQGLIGKWRSTAVRNPEDRIVMASPSPGVLSWTDETYKAHAEGKTDGSDIPVTGPTVPPGFTVAWNQVNPSTLSYTLKVNGKPDTYGRCRLATDRRSYEDVSWSPSKENEKSTSVYVRQ